MGRVCQTLSERVDQSTQHQLRVHLARGHLHVSSMLACCVMSCRCWQPCPRVALHSTTVVSTRGAASPTNTSRWALSTCWPAVSVIVTLPNLPPISGSLVWKRSEGWKVWLTGGERPGLQVVPLPFAEQQPGQQCSQPEAPIEPVVLAAQAAAAAGPLQPFEVRQLPFRAYAVVLTDRWVVL